MHRYDWIKGVPNLREDRSYRLPKIEAPASLRLTSGLPPVYQQGQIGSCTANAAACLWQFEAYKQKIVEFMPSRLFDYYNERVLCGDPTVDGGATVKSALQALATTGTVPESDYPYTEPPLQRPPDALYAAAKRNVVTSYLRVAQTQAAMASAIYACHPVQFGFTVYPSFESPETAQTGVVPMPDTSQTPLGGHSVVVTGYDWSSGFVWVRNSWGADWGLDGYCQFPLAYLLDPQLCADFWIVNGEQDA